MVDRADLAVEDFFKEYTEFDTLGAIQRYVKWAVPAPSTISDDLGRKIASEDHIFPYMYEYNNRQIDSFDPDVSSLLRSSSN